MQVDLPKTDAASTLSAPFQRPRRYDVGWLRTLALGLLIIYHGVISFQPWAYQIYFIQNRQSIEFLWIIMAMINVWRIPILFVISGMGVRFAMERRDWRQLLKDRTLRILIPFVFGYFTVCALSAFFSMKHYGINLVYYPNAGHLWFLANIFLYVLLLLPLLVYLKNRPGNPALTIGPKLAQKPWLLFLVALPLMLEAWLADPQFYVRYALSSHGFFLGLVCFALGFWLSSIKDGIWQAVIKIRWLALGLGVGLYLIRLLIFELKGSPNPLFGFETTCWILAILGFGSLYLNQPSRRLTYFSQAVYPVYIVHMPIQFAISYYLLPLDLPAALKLILLLAGTMGISLLVFELILKRIKLLRPFFGMKFKVG